MDEKSSPPPSFTPCLPALSSVCLVGCGLPESTGNHLLGPSFLQPGMGFRLVSGSKSNKSAIVMGKKDVIPGIYGTSLPLSNFSPQTPQTCVLESDGSAEKKFHSPEEMIGTGGILTSAFYKDHYKAAIEQLAALNMSKNSRTAQFSSRSRRQGTYHSWSYIHNQSNNTTSRDFNKPFVEMPSSSSDIPMNFITNPTLLHSYVNRYHPVSYPGTPKTTLENHSRNGDQDFFKKASEATASESYPATDSSSDDMLSVMKWNLKRGNGNTENPLAEEKYAAENEKSDVLLKYLKNANLNLRPEPIEHKEDVSSSHENNTFSYPDFLPPPYNSLDLQKLSLSKWDDWKLAFNPPLDESLDKLISRLVEMERLQHLTILRERTKEQPISPTMAVNNHAISSKDIHQLKQLKRSDLSYHHAAYNADPCSLGDCMQEPDLSKCTCQHCHNKWDSGASSLLRSTTNHFRVSCNKCSKAPVILDSSSVLTRKSLSCSGSSSKIRSAVKMTSSKLRIPSTPVACCLPDNANSKPKQPRTKRKTCRKTVSMGKVFHSQRLKSISVISKQKYSNADHQ
ncbi:protein FAM217A isoform X2 [Hemicordylus capensis]|uniref:protein FAM217A isoform X2 n=1 Tax=Hemicordylus capensis TaxID=884348 RepID=UPI0023043AB1|nr:protein FAM217A isoform X2 [Hemicordylus capensis]